LTGLSALAVTTGMFAKGVSNVTAVQVPPPKLVTTGPYHYTQNPMLTGVFSLLFGFGVFFGSVSLLFVFTPLFIYLNYWELKSIEEPELAKRLGEDYIQYHKRTPMFFPNFGGIFRKRE